MKAEFDAAGEVLIVTGGANGIGAGLAAAYAEAGGRVHVFDLEASGTTAPGVTVHTVDVSDRRQVFEAVEQVLASEGRIDALVAAAAIQPRTPVVRMPAEEWLRVIDVNLNGVVWAVQAVLPAMISARRGAILAFASGLANTGHPTASAYAASKGALISFMRSLAGEVAEHRVRANVVFPGVIDTPQFRKANPAGGELEHWKQSLGVGVPEDVAGALMFLLSDAASMTGSVLTRDRAFPVDESASDAAAGEPRSAAILATNEHAVDAAPAEQAEGDMR